MRKFFEWVLKVLVFDKCEVCGSPYDPYNDEYCKNCFDGWELRSPSMIGESNISSMAFSEHETTDEEREAQGGNNFKKLIQNG